MGDVDTGLQVLDHNLTDAQTVRERCSWSNSKIVV